MIFFIWNKIELVKGFHLSFVKLKRLFIYYYGGGLKGACSDPQKAHGYKLYAYVHQAPRVIWLRIWTPLSLGQVVGLGLRLFKTCSWDVRNKLLGVRQLVTRPWNLHTQTKFTEAERETEMFKNFWLKFVLFSFSRWRKYNLLEKSVIESILEKLAWLELHIKLKVPDIY